VFSSPWRNVKVDSVAIIENARIAVSKGQRSYCVEASIPLADLGITAPGGTTLKADFGVVYGDPGGAINMLRSYWSNKATGLVNDDQADGREHERDHCDQHFEHGGDGSDDGDQPAEGRGK